MILKQRLKKFLKENSRQEQSFTLIELVIVIGILAILAVVVIIVLNPAEFLKQSRDSTRMSDLGTINKSLGLYQADGGTSFGTSSTVYVSIPDSSSICNNLGLPSLPSGWSYACSSSDNFRKVNGNGWIPVNLTSITFGSTLDTLPIDPINATSTGNYYTYVVGGSWNLTAFFESEKYKMGGSNDKTSKDNGSYPELYEIGTNLTLLPVSRDSSLVGYWKFDETSGTLYDSSGHGNNGTQSGGVTYGAVGKVGNALSFDGTDDYVINSTLNLTYTNLTLGLWFKSNSMTNPSIQFPLITQGNNAGFRVDYNQIRAYHGGNSMTSQGGINAGEWYHGAIVYTGLPAYPNIKLYVNGTLVKEVTSTNNASLGTGILFGAIYGPSYFFNGLIDDVRIYNRALSAAEIAAIYNATK